MNEDNIITCSDCGCIIDPDNVRYVSTGRYSKKRIVCEDCLENYSYCECCDKYTEEDVIEVDGEWVCESCLDYYDDTYYRCHECGEYHRFGDYENRGIETWNGYYICDDCYDNEYETCADCGEVFRRDDMTEDGGDYYCADCIRDHGPIHDYGYKPDPVFKTGIHDVFYNSSKIKELMFGVELEIDKGDDPDDCASDLVDACEDIYCKHDGSLDDGVEIVSHPCSLEYHTKFLGWDKICRIARDHDFKSHEARTCGLHVHVGRLQFGDTREERDAVAAKLIMLVDRHWDNLVKFSRRQEEQLRWAHRPEFEYGEDEQESIENALNTENQGRYEALNLCNSETVEFRIFNGTLRVETIHATLQFVSNMCKYAMTHSVEDVMASQWDDIISTEEYKELREYLGLRNIVAKQIEKAQMKQTIKLKVGDIVTPKGWMVGSGEECVVVDVINNETWGVLVAFAKNMGYTHRGEYLNLKYGVDHQLTEPVGYWYCKNDLELVRRPEGEEAAAVTARLAHLVPWKFVPVNN